MHFWLTIYCIFPKYRDNLYSTNGSDIQLLLDMTVYFATLSFHFSININRFAFKSFLLSYYRAITRSKVGFADVPFQRGNNSRFGIKHLIHVDASLWNADRTSRPRCPSAPKGWIHATYSSTDHRRLMSLRICLIYYVW